MIKYVDYHQFVLIKMLIKIKIILYMLMKILIIVIFHYQIIKLIIIKNVKQMFMRINKIILHKILLKMIVRESVIMTQIV